MPILNLLVAALVLLIAYMWTTHGLFSALIHFVCAVVAGAVALAVWEPLTYTYLLDIREDIAWTIGLMGPFLLTLAALRFATDKLLPANIDFGNTANFIGGGVFGLGSAVISVGLLVISIGFMPLPANFLGYQRVAYSPSGTPSRAAGSPLWVPVDQITTAFYERLSVAGFGTSSPLATVQPNLHEQASLVRVTFDSRSRTTLSPEDVDLQQRYIVQADRVQDLLSDMFLVTESGEPAVQRASLPSGDPYPPGSRLEGYVLEFGPGAREKGGQVVVGAAQVRLVCETQDGEGMGLHPITVIAQAAGRSLQLGRFRFDAPDVFVSSVGGAARSKMAFEFIVPPDAEPVDLLVKNVRHHVAAAPMLGGGEPLTPRQRDEAVQTGEILGVEAETAPAAASAGAGSGGPARRGSDSGGRGQFARDVRVSNSLPDRGALDKQRVGGLSLNAEQEIVEGEHTFTLEEYRRSIPRSLQVREFATTGDTVMVQANVGFNGRISLFGRALDAAQELLPPVLRDDLGQVYQAVGYVYLDRSKVEIRYTPGDPIRALRNIPRLSRSRTDQELLLLFTVSRGVEVTSFGLGDQTLLNLEPPLSTGRGR